jgi:hypothetical protein
MVYIPTADNCADILTKPVSGNTFSYLIKKLMSVSMA